MTGNCLNSLLFFISRVSSIPSMTGIMTSDITTSSSLRQIVLSACFPFFAVYVVYFLLNSRCMSSSSSSLSSTIRILNLWSSSTLCENPLVRGCVLSISVTYGLIMSLLFISSVSSFAYCFLSVGILTVKTVPCSTTLWQSMLPWCSLTRSWVNDRPMPVPVVFFRL